jgi:hypothetical protein
VWESTPKIEGHIALEREDDGARSRMPKVSQRGTASAFGGELQNFMWQANQPSHMVIEARTIEVKPRQSKRGHDNNKLSWKAVAY